MTRDLVCFSHLRWDFVYQRPQHLMSRFAATHRVFFFEEPIVRPVFQAHVTSRGENVRVIVPHFLRDLPSAAEDEAHRFLFEQVLDRFDIRDFVLWFFTPLPVQVARYSRPRMTVYDCMDELSAFKDAPPALLQHERDVLAAADIVFTGGPSLYEAKRLHHRDVRLFPSSVDREHFGAAGGLPEPAELAAIPRPRIGYCGVIDERIDLDLLAKLAVTKPDWQFVMLGPVVKIDAAALPQSSNLHYLGYRPYDELPAHLGAWNAAMLPFADNAATRFISPTKTLEYIAAGIPVVSTPIRDVVSRFAAAGLVRIGASVEDFIAGIDHCLTNPGRTVAAEALLRETSWDRTAEEMSHCMAEIWERRQTDVLRRMA